LVSRAHGAGQCSATPGSRGCDPVSCAVLKRHAANLCSRRTTTPRRESAMGPSAARPGGRPLDPRSSTSDRRSSATGAARARPHQRSEDSASHRSLRTPIGFTWTLSRYITIRRGRRPIRFVPPAGHHDRLVALHLATLQRELPGQVSQSARAPGGSEVPQTTQDLCGKSSSTFTLLMRRLIVLSDRSSRSASVSGVARPLAIARA
jgi:hypothetical protein